MRKADFDLAWGKCRDPNRPNLSVSTITVQQRGVSSTLQLSSRVAGIIGGNGVGKTGLLRGIEALCNNPAPKAYGPSVSAVTGVFRGDEFAIDSAEGKKPDSLFVSYINTSLEASRIVDYFESRKIIDLNDLIDQAGFKTLSHAEGGLYRYLCDRAYASIKVAEVEQPVAPRSDDDKDDLVFPFFTVEFGAASYDCLSMGFGELCAFFTIWELQRAPKGSIVLLDEPDSHLSPAARKRLADVIAAVAHARQQCVIFSSHSIDTLQQLNDAEIFLLSEVSVGLAVNRRAALRALGLVPKRRLMAVVEDVDAKELLHQIIDRWCPDEAGTIDIQIVEGGAAEVVRFISLFPKSAKAAQVLAILDGDKQGDYADHEYVSFLPGPSDPVAAARSYVTLNPNPFAIQLGVVPERMAAALAGVAGADHHDFLARMVQELALGGIDVRTMRRALFLAWLTNDAVTQQSAAALANSVVIRVQALPTLDLM